MEFRLAEFGEVFATRPRGLEIRESLEHRLPTGECVSISFEAVARVSQSFSDEFLGALLAELGIDRVAIEGDLSPSVERVLNRALRHRGFPEIAQFAMV